MTPIAKMEKKRTREALGRKYSKEDLNKWQRWSISEQSPELNEKRTSK